MRTSSDIMLTLNAFLISVPATVPKKIMFDMVNHFRTGGKAYIHGMNVFTYDADSNSFTLGGAAPPVAEEVEDDGFITTVPKMKPMPGSFKPLPKKSLPKSSVSGKEISIEDVEELKKKLSSYYHAGDEDALSELLADWSK